MSRKEFMMQLEKLLGDIPQEERIEALAYYNGYFEDAGEENEEKIIQELESPEKVAKIIRADIGMGEQQGQEEAGEYTESGYRDQRFEEQSEVKTRPVSFWEEEKKKDTDKRSSNQDNTAKIILIVLAAIITSPIWLGLAGAAIGVIFGLLGGLLGITLGLVAAVFALYVVGVVLVGVGISLLVTGAFAAGLGLSGSGLLVLAIAVLGTIACVWLFGRLLPWLVGGSVRLCSSAFHRRGKAS